MHIGNRIADFLLAAVLGALVWLALHSGPARLPSIDPTCPPKQPDDDDKGKPKRKKRKPLLPWRLPQDSAFLNPEPPFLPLPYWMKGAKVGGRTAPDGVTQIQCDLPGDRHIKNVGGSDGAGLCVFTSMQHSCDLQNVHGFERMKFRAWMQKRPGGGYPSKVKKMLEQYSRESNVPLPDYIQVESNDLEILKLACKTGRMPGVTYSRSPTGRYGGQSIAHMVSLAHADDNWFCVLDNNYIGDTNYEWMTPAEFLRTYSGGRTGWAVVFLSPRPPMPPKNVSVK